MNPWLGIFGVLVVLGGLMALLKVFQSNLSAETSRKAAHVGMGIVCLSFPWLFDESWPVLALAVMSIAALGAIRFVPRLHREAGGVLGGVGRDSLGEFYFPIAVATVFLLADGNTLLYVIPVLTLTVADSVGALIGIRYGLVRYHTDEGFKSAEGSVAFFSAAFLSCHIPLLLFSDAGRAESLLIGLTAGLIVMLLEAVSWRGQDNLIIPVGMYFLLHFYLPLNASELLLRFLLVIALVLFALVWRRRTTLSDSAIFTGVLSGYAVWAFGGPVWLLPPLLLYLIYVFLPPFPKTLRPMQNLHAVTRVMAGGFLWILLAHHFEQNFLIPYLLCMAAHTGNIITARLRVIQPHQSITRIALIGIIVPSSLFAILAAAGVASGLLPVITIAWLPLATALSVALFIPAWPLQPAPEQRLRIWFSETVIAILASLPGLIQ